jgi:uncharacterized membrane protein YedE/YeeE
MRLVLAVLLVLAFAPAAQGTTSRPQLHLLNVTPASVGGSGFRARERVVVTLTGGSNHLKRTVLTNARGAFVARFTKAVAAPGCSQLAILAVGAQGDRASWKSPAKSCGPPPQPIAP